MNQHRATVLAALRDYEYKLDAHYDGQPEAMAERDAARAALAWVQTWGEATPKTCFVVMEWHDGVARSPIAAYGTREQAAERVDAFRDIVELPWESAPAPQQPAPIPDNPDGDDVLGLHRQRWVRIGWNTVVALQQMLAGDTSPVMRTLVEMLAMQAERELNTEQEPQPAMPQADWSQAPKWAMWWAVDDSGQAYWFDSKPYILGEMGWVTRSLQQAPDKVFPQLDWRQTLQARPTAQEVSGEANEESD